jgi:hypothetical protein
MFTRVIFTDVSSQFETWADKSWSKILAGGLTLLLAGIFVLAFARLVAFLIALALFAAAGFALKSAWMLWKATTEEVTHIEVD